MKIGQAIRTIRKELGVSQMVLSEKSGISQTALSKIENDARPSDANVKKICAALDIPELVLYVLASEASDIPAEKKQQYTMLQNVVKNLAREIVSMEQAKLLS